MKSKKEILNDVFMNMYFCDEYTQKRDTNKENAKYKKLCDDALKPIKDKIDFVYANTNYSNDVDLLKTFDSNYDFSKLESLDEDLSDRINQMEFHSKQEQNDDLELINSLKDERNSILKNFFEKFSEPMVKEFNDKRKQLLETTEGLATLFRTSGVPEAVCKAVEENSNYTTDIDLTNNVEQYEESICDMLDLIIPEDYDKYEKDEDLFEYADNRLYTISKINELVNDRNNHYVDHYNLPYGYYRIESENPEFVKKMPFEVYDSLFSDDAIASLAVKECPITKCDKDDINLIMDAFNSQDIAIDVDDVSKYDDPDSNYTYWFLVQEHLNNKESKEDYINFVLNGIKNGDYLDEYGNESSNSL